MHVHLKIEHSKEWLFPKFFEALADAKGTPLEGKPEQIVPFFDKGVDTLRQPWTTQNIHVNKLVTLAWRLIGNRHVLTAVTDKLPCPGIHFWAEVKPGVQVGPFLIPDQYNAYMLLPINWVDLCLEDPYQQMGGIVYNASFAADLWHGKLGEDSKHRASAYEAEFLLSLLKKPKTPFNPNEWQVATLDAMPKGLDSLPNTMRYDLQPYQNNLDFHLIEEQYRSGK